MAEEYQGACLCGAVQFSYIGPSLWCAHCHCTLCQRAHGAPLVTWVGAAEERFRFQQQEALCWYESSPGAHRGFCDCCGSTLFFQAQRWPGEMHIALSCLLQPIDIQPSGHVYWESHAPWFAFEDELPRKASDS